MSHRFGPRVRLTGAGVGGRIGQWLLRSQIKSVQRGTISIGAGATTSTAAITAVVLGNSRINFLGMASADAAVSITEVNGYLELTNATTVTGTHWTAGQALTLEFEVIEYWPGVMRSVQRGLLTITNGNTTNTAVLTLADTARAEVTWLGSASSGTVAGNYTARLTLTSATVLTATRVGSVDAVTTSYQVIQWW